MSNKRDSQGTWYPDGVDLDGIGAPDPESGTDVLRYRDAQEVGRGAMGRVYGVWDESLGRRVAYKVMARKVDSATARQRFFREARITARLEHPGIVPIYDLAHDVDGTPYYTMRFLEGQTLKEAIARAESLEQRLALLPRLIDACQAMAYAHDRGVIHRDLKPANVLLGAFGETLVVDWGLAKSLDDTELNEGSISSLTQSSDSTATRAGTVIGSPSYMSPEQAMGELERVNPSSDVWSLGVILYQLLTGKRPFTGTTGDHTLALVRRGTYRPVNEVEPDAPQELAAVCHHALQREQPDRYATAAELARELEAWQNGGWVRAYRYSTWERVGRFVERYRLPLGIVAVCAAIIALTGAASVQRVFAERDRALVAEAEAQHNLAEAYAGKAADALDEGKVLEAELFAAAALTMGERPGPRGILTRTRAHWRPRIIDSMGPVDGCYDIDVRDGVLLCGGRDGSRAYRIEDDQLLWHAETGKNISVAIHPSEPLVGVLSDQRLYLVDLESGQIRVDIEAFRKGNPPLAWHRYGEVLAYATSTAVRLLNKDGTERCGRNDSGGTITDFLWDGDTLYVTAMGGKMSTMDLQCTPLTPYTPIPLADGANALARHPNGDLVVGTTSRGIVHYSPDGTVKTHLPEPVAPAHRITFDPAGRHLFSLHEDGWVHISTLGDNPSTLSMPIHTSARGRILFLDERHVLVSAHGLQPQVWELPEERPGTTFGDGVSGQWNPSFSPSGQHLAVSTGAKIVGLYEPLAGPQPVRELEVSNRVVRQVLFADDQNVVIIDSFPQEVEVWDIRADAPSMVQPLLAKHAAMDYTRHQLYVATKSPQMQRWDDLTGPSETWQANDKDQMWDVVVSDDGSTLAYTDAEDDLWVFSLPGRQPLYSHHFDIGPRSIALSPDGHLLAYSDVEQAIVVQELPSGRQIARLPAAQNAVGDLGFSHDGRWLMAAAWDKQGYIWSTEDWQLRATLTDHQHRVVGLDVHPRDRWLATASWDGTTRLWSLDALEADPRAILDELERDLRIHIEDARMSSVRPGAPTDTP